MALILVPPVVWDSSTHELKDFYNAKIRKYGQLKSAVTEPTKCQDVQVFDLVLGGRGTRCPLKEAIKELGLQNSEDRLCQFYPAH